MAKIGILIDSASTYDEEFIKANNIQKIPLNFTDSNGKSVSDNGEIKAEEAFNEIKTTKVLWKTASSVLGDLMNKVDEMLQTYEKVIFIPVSWQLSSQYANATMLLSEFPGKFFIVKTNKAVYENELLYKKLVELINSGMDAQPAIDEAIKVLENTITVFSTMDNAGLVKSGRASKALIKAISLFKVKPVVEQYGKNHMVGFSTSFKGALKTMGEYSKKRFNVKSFDGIVNSVCILETFGQTQEQKDALRAWCKEILKVDDSKIFTRWLPLPVQVHTFPGSYGFCINCSIPNTGDKWTKDSDDE